MKRTGLIAIASLALAACVVKSGSTTWSSGSGSGPGPGPSGTAQNEASDTAQNEPNGTAQNEPNAPTSASSSTAPNSAARSNVGVTTGEATTATANPDAPFVGNSIVIEAGERPSREKQLCDGAHDHCLPKGVLFASDWSGGAADDALVVIEMERGLWAWKRSDIVRGQDFRGMDTERATTSTLKVGTTAIAFRMGAHWGDLPGSPADAIFGQWVIGKVTSVDSRSKTYRIDGEPEAIPIVAARIVTSSSPLPAEP